VSTYSPWAELTALDDLKLEWADDLPGRVLGHYVHRDRLIRIRAGLTRHQARCVLAHELRHAEHADDRPGVPWQEKRADREAARLLMADPHLLADAAVLHARHIPAMARELRVTVKLLRVRLEHLHPAERGLIAARLAEVGL
jgi:hypothetical protein